jgi:ribose-phosphate pyrophosphokinase
VLERIVVTDTVPPFRLKQDTAKTSVHVISCTGLFAKAIHSLHAGDSITELMAS